MVVSDGVRCVKMKDFYARLAMVLNDNIGEVK